MTWTRYALLVVVLLVSWSLIVSTGGISSMSMSRGLDGSVVSDEEAYLGVALDCNNGVLRVRITNQFSDETVLDVEVTVNGTTETFEDLRVRQSGTMVFRGVATGDTVEIRAVGSSASVRLFRTLPTGC